MNPSEIQDKLSELKNWKAIENHHLFKSFSFPDFKSALEFVNNVGQVAEKINHHPNISFTYGKAEITVFSHDIDGISEKDFILAKEIDRI
jgi:4a-hydroxytetrahydrobiopterin dehydratase